MKRKLEEEKGEAAAAALSREVGHLQQMKIEINLKTSLSR